MVKVENRYEVYYASCHVDAVVLAHISERWFSTAAPQQK